MGQRSNEKTELLAQIEPNDSRKHSFVLSKFVLCSGLLSIVALSGSSALRRSNGAAPILYRTKTASLGNKGVLIANDMNEDVLLETSPGLTQQEQRLVSAKLGLSATNGKETITLVAGCAPRDLLYAMNFEPDGWTGKVGAKLITQGMSSEFKYERALDMVEIGCGVWSVDYSIAPDAKFGFFLYALNDTKKYISDIGAQIEGGPVTQSEIAAHAWYNENHASLQEAKQEGLHTSTKGSLEEELGVDAAEDVQYSDLAAYRAAVESGHVNAQGHLVTEADPENVKLAPAMPAGYSEMKYYDWGALIKWIVHGPKHEENEIECDPSAQTCTLQHCTKWQCTDYTKPCQEGIEGCTKTSDYMSEAKLGRLGTVKRYKNPKSIPKKLQVTTTTVKKKVLSKIFENEKDIEDEEEATVVVGERKVLKSNVHVLKEANPTSSSSSTSTTTTTTTKSKRHKKSSTEKQQQKTPVDDDVVETIVEDIAEDVIVPTSNVAARAFHWDKDSSSATRGSNRRALKGFPSLFSYTPSHVVSSSAQLGLGTIYPSRLINYMADCNTKSLYVTNNGNENVEYYPRKHDASNAGHVYIFGSCFATRNQNTCAVPTDTHPLGCKDATAASETNTNSPTTTGNTQSGNQADQTSGGGSGGGGSSSTVTSGSSSSTDSNDDDDGTTSGASSTTEKEGDDTSSSGTTAGSTSSSFSSSNKGSGSTSIQYTPVDGSNIYKAVAECLGYEPLAGECPESQYGVMSDWDVSKVTNMDQLFYDPPRINGDKLKSFNGLLGNWDVSSVTSMRAMFHNANAFTGKNLYQWDVSAVQNMAGMFEHAENFNAKINGWNVGSVKTFATMFQNALNFDQDLSDWDVSSSTNFARMFSGVNMNGFAHDISGWPTKKTANFNNITYQNSHFQSKFTCTSIDNGPPSSCKAKSVAEMIASAMLAQDEETVYSSKVKAKKHSSAKKGLSKKRDLISHTIPQKVAVPATMHSTADSEAEDMVEEATEIAKGGKSLFNKVGSLFGVSSSSSGSNSKSSDEELSYSDYEDEILKSSTSAASSSTDESQGFDSSEEVKLFEPASASVEEEQNEKGTPGEAEEEEELDEWGEPVHKYDSDKSSKASYKVQVAHVDFTAPRSNKKASSTTHGHH